MAGNSEYSVFRKSDYKVMPWKNGLGITSQIDIYPQDAAFPGEDFLWRVSSASVQSDNPFSQFPGCDRLLAVFSGDGLNLNGQALTPSQIIYFKGEDKIQGDLLGGPVLDIGIIFRRDKVRAAMTFSKALPGQTQDLKLNHETHYLFCAQGKFLYQNQVIEAGDTLKIDHREELHLINSGSEEIKIYLVQLACR